MAAPDPHSVEAALDAVPGVADASVVLGARGGELRLVLEPGADERAVAPAVHRVLREGFGLGLDPQRLSVMEETGPEPVAAVPHLRLVRPPGPVGLRSASDLRAATVRHPAGSRRPEGPVVLDRLTVATDGLGAEVGVTLVRDGSAVTATAKAASTAASVLRAVATATTDAAGRMLGDAVRLEVEEVRVVPLGECTVAVVSLLHATGTGVERRLGVSEVREDPRQAVIRATLEAVTGRSDQP